MSAPLTAGYGSKDREAVKAKCGEQQDTARALLPETFEILELVRDIVVARHQLRLNATDIIEKCREKGAGTPEELGAMLLSETDKSFLQLREPVFAAIERGNNPFYLENRGGSPMTHSEDSQRLSSSTIKCFLEKSLMETIEHTLKRFIVAWRSRVISTVLDHIPRRLIPETKAAFEKFTGSTAIQADVQSIYQIFRDAVERAGSQYEIWKPSAWSTRIIVWVRAGVLHQLAAQIERYRFNAYWDRLKAIYTKEIAEAAAFVSRDSRWSLQVADLLRQVNMEAHTCIIHRLAKLSKVRARMAGFEGTSRDQ